MLSNRINLKLRRYKFRIVIFNSTIYNHILTSAYNSLVLNNKITYIYRKYKPNLIQIHSQNEFKMERLC
jgi:hypothetical protein